ncbi:hypothetical protein ATCV1_z570L [Acanthocystis turfacea chlorella virus 1]|uniref:Uncharacterized protein z570L n=1 Tax=Chlorovirus heliozoae TaxID=322019 RepID=A7K9I0_9PHYC|nr:hypothetical protein ATCV1_z570L [Acanthocystis turfacea chlorella virus 1]ABT16704.1 hypothetical protein ATCV1_z570L [Acanthocystis turfacea chlorella virus 1]
MVFDVGVVSYRVSGHAVSISLTRGTWWNKLAMCTGSMPDLFFVRRASGFSADTRSLKNVVPGLQGAAAMVCRGVLPLLFVLVSTSGFLEMR